LCNFKLAKAKSKEKYNLDNSILYVKNVAINEGNMEVGWLDA